MKTRERISSAQDSANLGEAPMDELADIDIIRACGMVGAKMPLGVSMWRLKYSGDSREFRTCLDGLVLLFERRWPEHADAVNTTVAVMKHWLDDVCHACHGRGYETVPGAPVLSEKQCGVCNGEGRLKLPRADEPAEWLQEQIARMEREVAGAIMRKLAADMEL